LPTFHRRLNPASGQFQSFKGNPLIFNDYAGNCIFCEMIVSNNQTKLSG